MSAEVVRFTPVQPATDGEVVTALMFQEAERILSIADAIAVCAYSKPTVGDLSPDKAALCRALATQALRGTNPKWNAAAEQHATNECADALKDVFPALSSEQRARIGKILATIAVSAHQGIMEALIGLPLETYLKIARPEEMKK